MLTNNLFPQEYNSSLHPALHPDRDPRAYVEALQLFENASRKAAWVKVWNWIRGRRCDCLLDLNEVRAHINLTGSHYAGVHAVPLSQIRGTQGRVCDFDGSFLPGDARVKARWVGVATAWFEGRGLPAVELVQIGDIYFVLDGNHRVSVARAMGKYEIDAVVVEWDVHGRLPWEDWSMVARALVAAH